MLLQAYSSSSDDESWLDTAAIDIKALRVPPPEPTPEPEPDRGRGRVKSYWNTTSGGALGPSSRQLAPWSVHSSRHGFQMMGHFLGSL